MDCLKCPNFWASHINEATCDKCGPHSEPAPKGKYEKEVEKNG